MSDAIGVLSRVNDPEPAPAAESIRCPHCEAELRNTRAEPGQTLRCLNCGKRFVPVTMEVTAGPDAPATSNVVRFSREVRTPGYWLLRIPAILCCIIGTFVAVMILYSYFERRSYVRFRDLAFLSYVPLLAVGGFVLLWLTKSLADIDNSLSRLLERRSPGSAELPPLTGSSLPYILPLAVIGGVMPLVAVGANERFDEVIGYSIWGAAMFLVAFALEDVRQYLWRQRELCARVLKADAFQERANPSTFATAFILLGLALLNLILFERVSNSEKPIFVFGALTLFGGALSLGRLDSQFSRVAVAWQPSKAPLEPHFLLSRIFWYAGLCGALLFGFLCYHVNIIALNNLSLAPKLSSLAGDKVFQILLTAVIMSVVTAIGAFFIYHRVWRPASTLPRLTRFLAMFPVFWATFAALVLIGIWVTQSRSGYRSGELAAGLLAASSAFVAAIWVSDFMTRWAVWRHGMQRALNVATEAAPLKQYQSRFILGVAGLVIVQFISITLEFSDSVRYWRRTEELCLIPLALGLFHYPTLWCASLLNEMWRGNATLNADVIPAADE